MSINHSSSRASAIADKLSNKWQVDYPGISPVKFLQEYFIKNTLIPSKSNSHLKERHLRIIWATWHLTTLFGWHIGTLLIKISFTQNESTPETITLIVYSIMYTMFVSSLLVMLETKGKHPGWIVLLLIGILLIAGNQQSLFINPTYLN